MSAVEAIDCKDLIELVNDYLEGVLDPAEIKRFEAHLDECDACRDYVEQMRQTVATAGRLGEDSLDDAARETMLATFRDWKRTRSQ